MLFHLIWMKLSPWMYLLICLSLETQTSIISDYNWIRTQNRLVRKRTLNHLTKLAKWLSCVLSTYLYIAFDCMFLSCQVRVSEWIQSIAAWMDLLFSYDPRICSNYRVECIVVIDYTLLNDFVHFFEAIMLLTIKI